MKRTLLISVIALLIHNLHAQDKWAPIGAEWHYTVPDQYGDPLFSFEKYVVTRDTVIDEKHCVIIESEHNIEIMYEDNNKVYYRHDEVFNLIYDFSVNVGDTVEYDFKSFTPNSMGVEADTTYKINCVVESINNIEINGQTVKKFTTRLIPIDELDHLDWSGYTYWERFGYEYGIMFELSTPSIQIDNVHRLRCYNDNKISFVSDWWRAENKPCDYSLTSNINSNQINSFQIFPNPVLNDINITTNHLSLTQILKVMILDLTGKIILEDMISSNQKVINASAFEPGIYIVQLFNNNTFFKPFKVIKL